jgi:hypothetical protein
LLQRYSLSTTAAASKTGDNLGLDTVASRGTGVDVQFPPLSKFEEIFNSSSCKDIHDVKEGGYVDLDAKDIATYFPEGMAGEMDEEFEFSGRTAWMVRDSGKLLCRLVEEFEMSKGIDLVKNTNRGTLQGLSAPLNVPGLTDRPEWDDAKMRVFQYGTDFTSHEKKEVGVNLVAVRGEGSIVEDVIKRLKTSPTGVPTKVMLTGELLTDQTTTFYLHLPSLPTSLVIILIYPKKWKS